MTPSALQLSAKLLKALRLRESPIAAAACLLLAEVLDEGGNAWPGERARLLEESVRLEPGWVNNHESLAWAYLDAGR